MTHEQRVGRAAFISLATQRRLRIDFRGAQVTPGDEVVARCGRKEWRGAVTGRSVMSCSAWIVERQEGKR